MRRIVYIACAGLVLCAAVIVRYAEMAIDWMLDVLRPEPATFDLGGELVPARAVSMSADPRAERHEAGMSRRSAARGI